MTSLTQSFKAICCIAIYSGVKSTKALIMLWWVITLMWVWFVEMIEQVGAVSFLGVVGYGIIGV
jgi:hypothetical protein